jgi:tRNA(adenine34) deaminase
VRADDEALMGEALAEARQSLARGDLPVGAVLVHEGEIVARAHWTTSPPLRLLDHAEMLVLMEAERTGRISSRQQRRSATLYTTLEPCALCMAAAMSFVLGEVVFAAEASIDGAANLPDLWQPRNGHPADAMPYGIPAVIGGVRRDESLGLLAEWVRSDPSHAWAAGYLPSGTPT